MNRLKELRQKKGDTQEVVAKAMGVTRRGYQKWENEESQIKPEKAQQLADYFGVSVGSLLGYEDDSSLIKELGQKISKMSGTEAMEFAFTEEGDLLAELMYQAELKKEKQNNKKFRNFVKFLKTNIIVLNDEEIENFYNMLLTADLNSEDFTKAVDFLENNGYTIFFDKSYNDD